MLSSKKSNISRDTRSKCKPYYPAKQDIAQQPHHPEHGPFLTHPIPLGSTSNKEINSE